MSDRRYPLAALILAVCGGLVLGVPASAAVPADAHRFEAPFSTGPVGSATDAAGFIEVRKGPSSSKGPFNSAAKPPKKSLTDHFNSAAGGKGGKGGGAGPGSGRDGGPRAVAGC